MNDEIRVGAALRAAYDKMKKGEPEGRAIVMHVLGVAAEIEDRQEIQNRIDNKCGRPRLAKPVWTTQMVHTPADRIDAEMQRHAEIKAAKARSDSDHMDELRHLGYVQWVEDDEIGLPEAIYQVFGSALAERGKTAARDMAILKMSARNKMTDKQIAQSMNVSPGVVRDCKRYKAAVIWNALRHLVLTPGSALKSRNAESKTPYAPTSYQLAIAMRPRVWKNFRYAGFSSQSRIAA